LGSPEDIKIPNVQHLLGIKPYQAVEIQRRASELKVEEHAKRMGQDLANQSMLKVPQVMRVVRALSEREGLQVAKVHLFLSGYCAKCRTGGTKAKLNI
jgi:hypothetical protein